MRVFEYVLRGAPLLHLCFQGDFVGEVTYTAVHLATLLVAARIEGLRVLTML